MTSSTTVAVAGTSSAGFTSFGSKLLLQMEKGEDGIACLRSKNLDDIEINEMDGKSKA